MKRAAALFLLLGFPLCGLRADVPVRTEQLVYSIIACNGRDYSPTFAPESSTTIYLLAQADSFLSVRKTLVYFWPLTGKLQTDTNTLNKQLPGSLQVRDPRGAVLAVIPLERYTFFNVRGEYEQNWKVAVGDAADREYERSQQLSRDFLRSVDEYNRLDAEYLAWLRRLSDRVQALKAAGKDASELTAEMSSIEAPRQPVEPREYIVPPAPIQQAFVVNLPPGEFQVRLLNADGSVMEGSDKRIVSYSRRRAGGVGYEVIPSDKWTRPELSKTPSSVLYVNGNADLYLNLFFQDEFNDLFYQKTVDNAARGNPNVYTWVRVQHVPHASLEVRTADGRALRLEEQPWTVQQTQGASLGYTIEPYDPGSEQKDPDLVAFRLPVTSSPGWIRFRALDSRGVALPGSERQVRLVRPASSGLAPGLMSLLPIAVMVIILSLRARYHRGQP